VKKTKVINLDVDISCNFLSLYPKNAQFCTKLPPHYKALYVYRQNCSEKGGLTAGSGMYDVNN